MTEPCANFVKSATTTPMFKHISLFIGSLALATGIWACSDDNGGSGQQTPASIAASPEALTFGAEGGTASFSVKAGGEWDAATSDAWIKLAKSGTLSTNGTVEVTADANSSRTARTASITLLSGTARAKVTVTQDGQPRYRSAGRLRTGMARRI